MRVSIAVLAFAAAVAAPVAASAADYPEDYGYESRDYDREPAVERRVVVEEPVEEEIVVRRRPPAVVIAPGLYYGAGPGWRHRAYHRGWGYGRGYGFRGRYVGYRGHWGRPHRGRW